MTMSNIGICYPIEAENNNLNKYTLKASILTTPQYFGGRTPE